MDYEGDAGDADDDEEDDDGDDGAGSHGADDTVTGVVFITRAGCTLCETARPLVERQARRRGRPFAVVDVDRDPALADYGDRVPVVLLDGEEVLAGRFDRREVRRALA